MTWPAFVLQVACSPSCSWWDESMTGFVFYSANVGHIKRARTTRPDFGCCCVKRHFAQDPWQDHDTAHRLASQNGVRQGLGLVQVPVQYAMHCACFLITHVRLACHICSFWGTNMSLPVCCAIEWARWIWRMSKLQNWNTTVNANLKVVLLHPKFGLLCEAAT